MAYIDIYIEEFDDDEVLREAISRLRSIGRSFKTDAQKQEIREIIMEFNALFSLEPTNEIRIDSYQDRMKLDLLLPVYENYTYQQIEQMVSNFK